MTRILDRSQMGYRVLQDHSPDAPPERRLVTGAVRIVGNREDLPGYLLAGEEDGHHTFGDDHPYRFWAGASRGFGSWSPAYASESQGSAEVDASPQQVGGAQQGSGGNPPASSGVPMPAGAGPGRVRQSDGSYLDVAPSSSDPGTAAEKRTVQRALPVRRDSYRGDDRYATRDHSVQQWMETWPRGYRTIAMAGTEESEQTDLLLSADSRIVAPHKHGPNRAGTLVTDLEPDDTIPEQGPYGSGGRAAPIQTHLRVVRAKGSAKLGIPEGNVASWLGGLTGQAGALGGGAYYGPTDTARANDTTVSGRPPGDLTPSTRPPGDLTPGNLPAPGPSPTTLGGGVASPAPPPPSFSSPAGSAQRGKMAHQAGPEGLALMDWRMHGPLKVGGTSDKHHMGTTRDGEPMRSGHLATSALWHMDDRRDAPMHFRKIPYPKVKVGPYPYRVFLSHDDRPTHPWFDTQKVGLWDWWTSIPIAAGKGKGPVPDTPTEPPGDSTPGDDVPGDTTPGDSGTPGDTTGGPPGDASPPDDSLDPNDTDDDWGTIHRRRPPTQNPTDVDPADRYDYAASLPEPGPPSEALASFHGVGPSDAASGVESESLMLPATTGLASTLWRPQDVTEGAADWRSAPSQGRESSLDELARRPAVVRTEAWGARSVGEWQYVEAPETSPTWGGTGLGGALAMPPEREMRDYRDDEPAAPSTVRYDALADGVAHGYGSPEVATGDMVDGSFRVRRDSGQLVVEERAGGGWGQRATFGASFGVFGTSGSQQSATPVGLIPGMSGAGTVDVTALDAALLALKTAVDDQHAAMAAYGLLA